jgi:glycosyltransferase involved in cell wall biosynthesis
MTGVQRKFPDFRLVLVGEGGLRSDMEALADSLEVRGAVEFAGALPPAAVAERMRRSALFVLPSLEEGLGAVLLEAMASGTPCAASSVGGIPEILPEKTGWLVPPGDPEALAGAICGMLRRPERLRSMGLHAREHAVRNFGWEDIATRIVTVYEQTLARYSAAPGE